MVTIEQSPGLHNPWECVGLEMEAHAHALQNTLRPHLVLFRQFNQNGKDEVKINRWEHECQDKKLRLVIPAGWRN
jgi:hypothetical protein